MVGIIPHLDNIHKAMCIFININYSLADDGVVLKWKIESDFLYGIYVGWRADFVDRHEVP